MVFPLRIDKQTESCLKWDINSPIPFRHKPERTKARWICFSCRTMYILGYIPKDNKLYLSDKDMNVVGYSLLLSVLEYQTAVMRQDFETAKLVMTSLCCWKAHRDFHRDHSAMPESSASTFLMLSSSDFSARLQKRESIIVALWLLD